MLDLVVSRDIPEENDDDNDNDNEGGDGSKDGGGAAASGGEKGKDKDKKDDKGDTNSKDKSRDVNAYVKKKAEDKSENKNTSADGGSGNGKTDAKNKPGDGGGIVEEDENLVDLFLDLSVADTAGGWSIYGSSESLPSRSPSCRPTSTRTSFTWRLKIMFAGGTLITIVPLLSDVVQKSYLCCLMW